MPSGNISIEEGAGCPGHFAAVPLSGEVSRWLSRLTGYAALLLTCGALARALI